MKRYLYAISVVSYVNGAINNRLLNGLDYIDSIKKHTNEINNLMEYTEFGNNVMLLNVNIFSLEDNKHEQINRQYKNEKVEVVMKELAEELEKIK